MKETQDISQVIRQLHATASSKLDERVYGEIAKAAAAPRSALSGTGGALAEIFTLFLKKKSARYTLATTLGLVLLVVLALNRSTSSAWAMERAIEALKKYKALHITGYVTTGGGTTPLDAWARADATGNLVETGLAKWGDMTVWTTDNKTYTYDHAHNLVFVEPGITLGLNPWFGPKLLTQLARMKDYKAFEGEDAATGQKRAVVTCSIEIPTGPHSFLMEFDVRTRLLVSVKGWLNLKQEGAPNWYFEKIVYFEDLPDSAFNFQPPAETPFTDMPLTIPEASLSSLSDPKCGISAEGMSREQACEKILRQLWEARAKNDLARIRQLWPATSTWSDEMLRNSDDQTEGAKLLKIGDIERTGRSKLGPLALVPMWIRNKDGGEQEVWVIVQFRETGQGTSCVVQGTHGYALNVKK
jgi:hypothetical protein